jgi:hypothetical protein
MASSLDTGLLTKGGADQPLEGLWIHLADPDVLVYVLRLRAWVVRLAVRGRRYRDGVTDDTDHHLYDRLRRCHDRASRDATGMHGGDGGNPEEPTTLGLPAALVVVGVLMMVIGSFRQGDYASAVWLQLGSALALFGRCLGPNGCSSGDHRASPPALGCEISTSR